MSIQALRSLSFQGLSLAAAAVVSLVVMAPASAQSSDTSYYLGVSYGLGLPVPNNCRGAVACDRATDASKVFLGYKTSQNWAYEVTYFYFGKQQRAFGSGVADNAVLSESNRSWGAGLGVSLETELFGTFTNHLRAGLGYFETNARGELGDGSPFLEHSSRVMPYVGAGLSFPIMPGVRVHSGLDIFFNKKSPNRTNMMLTFGGTAEF